MAATKTKIETFPKTDWSHEQVLAVRLSHLAHGAAECAESETDTAYVLTTTWPILE